MQSRPKKGVPRSEPYDEKDGIRNGFDRTDSRMVAQLVSNNYRQGRGVATCTHGTHVRLTKSFTKVNKNNK